MDPQSENSGSGKRAHGKVAAGATRRVRKPARRANRKRPDYLKRAVAVAGVLLAAEMVAVALYSPRLSVRDIRVVGCETIAPETIAGRLGNVRGTNMVSLSPARLRSMARIEPVVGEASVERKWPRTLVVSIRERAPALCARLPDGVWYTLDSGWVAFRSASKPEPGLPIVRLGDPNVQLVGLGRSLVAPCRSDVESCLTWSRKHPDFPIRSVVVDRVGNVCLNSASGVKVSLGYGTDLDRKLGTLSQMVDRSPELRTGTAIASINLYAHDRPALRLRSLPPPAASPNSSKPNPSLPKNPSGNLP